MLLVSVFQWTSGWGERGVCAVTRLLGWAGKGLGSVLQVGSWLWVQRFVEDGYVVYVCECVCWCVLSLDLDLVGVGAVSCAYGGYWCSGSK